MVPVLVTLDMVGYELSRFADTATTSQIWERVHGNAAIGNFLAVFVARHVLGMLPRPPRRQRMGHPVGAAQLAGTLAEGRGSMTAESRARLMAAAWMIGGAAWVANGLLGLDTVEGSGGFYVSEIAWVVVHGLVLAGLVGLLRLTPRDDVLSRRGFTVALVGRVGFLVAEIAAIAVADDEIALLPIAAILTAAGMLVGGAGVLRSRRWTGWAHFAPLIMGASPPRRDVPPPCDNR